MRPSHRHDDSIDSSQHRLVPVHWILLQQGFDELLGVAANIVPVRRWKVKAANTNRLENLLIRITIERRVATKENVRNHTNGPPLASKSWMIEFQQTAGQKQLAYCNKETA
jgi:hypothetical protein